MVLLIGMSEIFLALFCFSAIRWFSNRHEILWNWPGMGALPDLLFSIHQQRFLEWLQYHAKRCSGTYLFRGPWFVNMDILGTVDQDNMQYILNTNFSNYPKGPEFKKIFDIFGDGIFRADFDTWKPQRKIAVALTTDRKFYQFLVKTTKEKVEKGLIPLLDQVSAQGMVVDLQGLAHRFTSDINWKLVTGYDCHNLSIEFPDDDFFEAMDDVEEAILYRHVTPEIFWKLQKKLRFGPELKMEKAWGIIDRKLENLVMSKKRGEDGESIDLLASHINSMKSADKQIQMGSKSPEKTLRDIVFNFLFAGRENSLAWFFWFIATKPDVEAKIIEELKALVPSEGTNRFRVFDAEELKNLVYLHATVCETLRLYPSSPFQHKSAVKHDILPSGHHVCPGMKIIASAYVMGRMRNIWGEDCLEFKPERWISEGGSIKHVASHKFIAFSSGPRACVGKQMVLVQMKAMAAAVVYNYHVQVVEGQTVVPTCASIVLHMKNGLKARIKKRWP